MHRAILCSRSGFFDGACSNQFREAQTGIIDLEDDDEEAIEHMIHCMYQPTFNRRSITPQGALLSRKLTCNHRLLSP